MRRLGTMRLASLPSCLALVTLGLAGCVDGAPEELALELELADAAEEELELPDYEVIPDSRAMLPPLGPTPHLSLIYAPIEEDPELCEIEIEASGFPAIRSDGHTLVHQLSEIPGAGDLTQHWLITFEGDAERRTLLYEDVYASDVGGDCEGRWRAAQAAVDAANAELEASSWRTLERMSTLDDWEHDPEVPALDLHWHAGWFAIRLPGQKLLQREAKPGWRGTTDEFCTSEPAFRGLWFDRSTRRALVTYDYGGPSCMCDDSELQDTLVLSQAAIDAADDLDSAAGVR